MKKILLLSFLITVIAFYSYSDEITFGGYVRNYSGLTLDGEESEYIIVQNSLNVTMEYSINNLSFLVNPYFNYNLDDDNLIDFNLRQTYMDIYFDILDIRVGQQQIMWGKADGAFITDVVSPKNLEEFLLPEFEEIRMPVTALKMDLYLGNSSIEAIFVPLFTPNKMPEQDSIWNNSGLDLNSGDKPDKIIKNSEFFGKYSIFTSLIDFEIMGGYMWDDEPRITPDLTNPTDPTIDYTRLVVIGGSFSSTLGELIIRGEGAYYMDKYFQMNPPQNPIDKDYINYLIGFDFRKNGWLLSTQFVQKIIQDYDDNLISDKINNTFTFVIKKDILRDTLSFEVFTYLEINDLNALIRPKISYELTDGMEIIIGSNIFVGNEGSFGQYNNNNMVYSKLKFSF